MSAASDVIETASLEPDDSVTRRGFARRNPTAVIGGALLFVLLLIAILAPLIGTTDPQKLSPIARLKLPSAVHWFGTDHLGRDLYSRVIYGSRISLVVGFSVAGLSISIGLQFGLLTGFIRILDHILMRVIEGVMAIPAILLAIALIALTSASVKNVVIALTIAEIPRVTRLVRSVVLTLRGQPFVESAIAVGTPLPMILLRHILPNTLAPLIVQGTFVCGSAIIAESILSFIGAGTPASVPTWGNIISDGRNFFQLYPHMIAFPAIFLSLTVLAINMLGDGLRDLLDPRLSRQI
jgi:peptide/nickel transport system permease protein